jgi:hypothetical protein
MFMLDTQRVYSAYNSMFTIMLFEIFYEMALDL